MSVESEIINGFYFFRNKSPIDTGNLRYNSIKFRAFDTYYEIEVDEGIAPYMKYTNENWDNFAPPLYGKKNPNEGWFDRAVDSLAIQLAHNLNGIIEVIND